MPDRPVIMIVDDEPSALSALEETMARRYAADYRIVPHLSPRAALEDLARLHAGGDRIALVIADQWMPEMTGIELLGHAHQIDPDAQRALLVAWGDRSSAPTILQGCAFGQLDNYLIKPWSPAEVHLYPAVSEFLADWTRAHGPKLELVRVVGSLPSARMHRIRDLLERSGVPYGLYVPESQEGQRLLRDTGLDPSRLPAVILLDGQTLVDPTETELSDALSFTAQTDRDCDLAIVGAGPAGLAAAVYSASEGLRTVVVEREVVGGQAGTSSLIRNYLGFPRGISGAELAQRAYQQAWLFGTRYALAREATQLLPAGGERLLRLSDGSELRARAVLIATGARYRRLDIPELERLVGAGLYYAAVGDSRPIAGHEAFVVGGGNSAGQAVVHLAKHARKVTLLVRADTLEAGMSDYLVREIRRLPTVEVRLRAEVIGGGGGRTLEYIVVRDLTTGATETLPAEAIFVLIGAQPHTDWLAGTLQRNPHGFIVTGPDLDLARAAWPLDRPPMRFETSMPGVFAAGDVRFGALQRVASAVGDGSVVLRYVRDYLARPADLAASRGDVQQAPVTPSP